MANELVINYPTGATLYALLFDATGQVWNGSAFEAVASANWTNYDIAMSEVATATGVYLGTMPAAAAGVYGWTVRKQAGGSPAVSDVTVGTGRIEWSGTAEIMPASTTNITAGTITTVTNVSNGVTLADDAITAAKYDESTAYPLRAADSGATYIARTGADADTLKNLSDQMDAILDDTGTTLPALFAASGATVTVISSVAGGDIEVRTSDTWLFTVTLPALVLTDYNTLALVVKRTQEQADDAALLHVNSDNGLLRINAAAPSSAGNGSLSFTATAFTGTVHMAETANVTPRDYVWFLKGFDTDADPDEGYELSTGKFTVKRGGLRAITVE